MRFLRQNQIPRSAGDLVVERLGRVFVLKKWRVMYIILLDFSEF